MSILINRRKNRLETKTLKLVIQPVESIKILVGGRQGPDFELINAMSLQSKKKIGPKDSEFLD